MKKSIINTTYLPTDNSQAICIDDPKIESLLAGYGNIDDEEIEPGKCVKILSEPFEMVYMNIVNDPEVSTFIIVLDEETNLRHIVMYTNPIYLKEQKERINRFKSQFRAYFEGYYDGHEYSGAIYKCNINDFDITNLEFSFEGELMIVNITLGRPGLIIGKGGNLIDALIKYFEKDNIKLEITESKIWNRIK